MSIYTYLNCSFICIIQYSLSLGPARPAVPGQGMPIMGPPAIGPMPGPMPVMGPPGPVPHNMMVPGMY